MGQFTVRNIEDAIKLRLKRLAARHGISMEEEVRQILRSAVIDEEDQQGAGLCNRIAARFARVRLPNALPELNGQAPHSVEFDR